MKKLIPDFLKQIDHKLMTSYPLVWRTRVHYFLFFALVGNLLAVILPTLAISVFGAFPSENFFYTGQVLGGVFSGFLLLFWGFDQQRFKMFPQTLKNHIATMGLYVICVLCVGSVFFTSTHTAVHQIAIKGSEGLGEEYYDFLRKNKLFDTYSDSYSSHLTTIKVAKAKEIMTFFNYSYTVVNDNYISMDYPYALRKKANVYDQAQAYYYEGSSQSYNSFSELFNIMMIGWLLALFLVPSFLMVLSGVGLPLTFITIGIQFFTGIGIVLLSFSSGYSGSELQLPMWYFLALLISLGCIASIVKPSTISRFMAWSTVPFIPLFMIMLYFTSLVNMKLEETLFFAIPYGLLFAGVSFILTGVMGYLVASRVELPKAK